MRIKKAASAGSQEKGDVLIQIEPIENSENYIEIKSSVIKLFGSQIKKSIEESLVQYQLKGVKVTVNDRGALDFVIKARFESAVKRGEIIE